MNPTYHPAPSRPRLELPAGSCDTHCHVFGPVARFPYAAQSSYKPAEAPKERLAALHERLGLERAVIVQAACHGYDNRVTADAVAQDPTRYRGVALLPTEVSDRELESMTAQGFCAVRFSFMPHLPAGPPESVLRDFAERLSTHGWHLLIHSQGETLMRMLEHLVRLPVPVVIDHMGRVDASLGIAQPVLKALIEALESENLWVKVSGSERASRSGPPYADGVRLARHLVERFAHKTLWGTDWPHPNFAGAAPDDGLLVDLLEQIAPDERTRQQVLVDNPARLYGFDEPLA